MIIGQQVFTSDGDPNGEVEAGPRPAICMDTTNNIEWWRTVTERGDEDWE